MTLVEKILQIYTDLTISDFTFHRGGTIMVESTVEKGEYIKEWNHLTYARPTQEQLDAVE